jgi:hypothetical protein
MRICFLPPKVIGERLKEDQCSVHGVSLSADVVDPESPDHCPECARRWNALCDSDEVQE